MIIKIKNTRYFKTVMFFVYEGIYLLFIDAFNQYLLTRSFDISNYLINNLVVFNIVWILLFFNTIITCSIEHHRVVLNDTIKILTSSFINKVHLFDIKIHDSATTSTTKVVMGHRSSIKSISSIWSRYLYSITDFCQQI